MGAENRRWSLKTSGEVLEKAVAMHRRRVSPVERGCLCNNNEKKERENNNKLPCEGIICHRRGQ